MKAVHSIAYQILKDEPLRGFLLDLAGGDGGFAARLNELGYRAICCDLYPGHEIKAPLVWADTNAFLPFRDNSFQFVTCMESLQYLENHRLLFRELRRVLKKNSTLILSVPNILNISSRLYFLNRGYFKYFKPFKKNREGREWDRIIYSPVSFVEIFQSLKASGFVIRSVAASKYRNREWPVFVLFRLFQKLLRRSAMDDSKTEMLDFMHSREILLGDHIIVVAGKID